MSTRYEFDNEAIESFCNNYGVTIPLTQKQLKTLATKGKTSIMLEQLSNVANQFCPSDESLEMFIDQKSVDFQPMALSLYVFNDSLWKLMEKKTESADTMLPMATIPRFYWKKSAATKKNPYGVKKDLDSGLSLNIEPHHSVAFQGVGGDFCGILEGQLVEQETGPRPILAPTFPGLKEKVPKYEIQNMEIRMQFGNLRTNLYPEPSKSIDYTFSEHPRIFYEHGLSVSSEGMQVRLGIGKKKAQPLHGDIILLLGKHWESETSGHEILFYHVWLNALSELLK